MPAEPSRNNCYWYLASIADKANPATPSPSSQKKAKETKLKQISLADSEVFFIRRLIFAGRFFFARFGVVDKCLAKLWL